MLKAFLISNTNLNIHKEVELLNPFEAATHLLSGVNYPTIGFREKLETEFTSLKTSNAKYCRNAILEDLTSRWNFFQELCLKGSFFNPRFKSLDFINSQEECDNIFSQLREEFMIFKQNEQIDNSTTSADKDTDDLMTEMSSFWKKKNSKAAPIKDEFQHYFDIVELPVLEEYDPYLWSTNKNQYPVLYKLAMKYLSIPATSVPSAQQIQRFNRLVATILKQVHHCPRKIPPPVGSASQYSWNLSTMKKIRVNVKNLRRKFKRKNKLPPLLPGFIGDAVEYYKARRKINLNVPFIRNHYWRESLTLAQINHCNQVISQIDTIMKYPEVKVIEDVTSQHVDDDRTFVISPEDSALLASPNVFLHRIHAPPTPPPDRPNKRIRATHDRAIPLTSASLTPSSPL
ncbi:hypothetical protein RclHR1_01060004 [Rhizophagus clarus]|uniref:HAT C-terminal dimerisation domain-containing protein n=1 Tax=Rhizophagus clarus TaxID=94130 RepID=A0A2Z6Q1Z5_9GLOM|nr:hypothetical protein RclHR1_01060004 [Rhizophagus clarus]